MKYLGICVGIVLHGMTLSASAQMKASSRHAKSLTWPQHELQKHQTVMHNIELHKPTFLLATLISLKNFLSVCIMQVGKAFIFEQTSEVIACPPAHRSFQDELDQVIREQLKKKNGINARDKFDNTLLMFACEAGYVATIEKLLQNGAAVNLKNQSGHTALMIAAYYGRTTAVELLLRFGKNMSTRKKDREGLTAVDWACIGNNFAIAKLLLLYDKSILDTKLSSQALF